MHMRAISKFAPILKPKVKVDGYFKEVDSSYYKQGLESIENPFKGECLEKY